MKTTTLKTPTPIIGSISSGTMREEDLIPCFLDCLEHFSPDQAAAIREEHADDLAKLGSDDCDDDTMESLSYLLNETLCDALQQYAPPYFCFGSHPGDGADYGFWLSENFRQDFEDDGGLVVNDLSELPEDYEGSAEVLVVNDHGNMTLYAVDGDKLNEIWSLV